MKLVHHITGISYTFDLHAPLTIVNHSLLDLPLFCLIFLATAVAKINYCSFLHLCNLKDFTYA